VTTEYKIDDDVDNDDDNDWVDYRHLAIIIIIARCWSAKGRWR